MGYTLQLPAVPSQLPAGAQGEITTEIWTTHFGTKSNGKDKESEQNKTTHESN